MLIIARKVKPKKYFYDSLGIETEDCILWNYYKTIKGYGTITINKKSVLVHRLSLIIKKGDPPIGKELAIHSCRNKNCFNYKHLRWGSAQDNSDDKIRDGTNNINLPNNAAAKLNRNQVIKIYKDSRKYKDIAKDYGLCIATIGHIKCGINWSWLTKHKK